MSNALTLVWGAFFAHNVLWWNWPSGKSFSSIKLTESMALAVDGISLFYTSLSGAMLWSCLLDSGVDFTYRLFTSDYTERRPSLHTGACHCQGFKEPLRLYPQWSCERASVPRNQVCSKCCNKNLPLKDYAPSSKIPILYLHNVVLNGPQRHA